MVFETWGVSRHMIAKDKNRKWRIFRKKKKKKTEPATFKIKSEYENKVIDFLEKNSILRDGTGLQTIYYFKRGKARLTHGKEMGYFKVTLLENYYLGIKKGLERFIK